MQAAGIRQLPTVLSVAKVQRLLAAVEPQHQLMVKLLFGSCLRLTELMRLRVKDLDFDGDLVVVRSVGEPLQSFAVEDAARSIRGSESGDQSPTLSS